MSAVYVGIPITKLSTRLIIRKGQPWSVIEHLVLDAIAQWPHSRLALAQRFNLRPTFIDSALMRLGRAFWIEMHIAPEGLLWVATPLGRAGLLEEELPSPGRIISRPKTILIDRLAGHLFSPGELNHDRLDRVQAMPDYESLCVLSPQLPEAIFRVDELVTLLRDDEQLLDIDATQEQRTQEVAIVRIHSGEVEGLPRDRELPELLERIRAGIESVHSGVALPKQARRAPQTSTASELQRHKIRIESQDLLIGGDAHRQALEAIFARATSRIILHSTFIGEKVFRDFLPLMRSAVKRGVQIDILWGQDPVDGKTRAIPPTADVIRTLNSDPQISALADRLHLHELSTRSHAKVILADVGRRGDYIALVGSCNWLASNLNSIEVTFRVRAPAVVAEVVQCLSNLLYASDGTAHELALALLRITRSLKRRPSPDNPNATAQLVVGTQHQSCVRQARDRARRRLFVMSHRLSELVTPAILVPFARAQARAQRRLTATALYGRLQDEVIASTVQRIEQQARADGVVLKRIRDPRIHAKVLAWDSDSIVVSSQNWLSADPMEVTLATELGIAVESRGIADQLVGNVQRLVEMRGARKVSRKKYRGVPSPRNSRHT
jgi:phosphatidylserine/phosphatidylglycerophosphate/cardiolipin synthase-like enzyme